MYRIVHVLSHTTASHHMVYAVVLAPCVSLTLLNSLTLFSMILLHQYHPGKFLHSIYYITAGCVEVVQVRTQNTVSFDVAVIKVPVTERCQALNSLKSSSPPGVKTKMSKMSR